MNYYLTLTPFILLWANPITAQDSVEDQHNAAKKLSMAGQTIHTNQPRTKPNSPKTALLRTKIDSPLFTEYKTGIATQNKTKYVVALPNESVLAAAHRLKISYHKLLKYNDLQEGEPLLNYQYIYLEPKKTYFSEQEPAFFKVEQGETLYEIAQFYGIRLMDLQQRNGLKPNEEVANGELILLNQRAVTRPKLRQSEFKISESERLKPIEVEEILREEQTNTMAEDEATSTYPHYIYQTQVDESNKTSPQLQIAVPAQNEVKTNKGSISIFGRPAIVDED